MHNLQNLYDYFISTKPSTGKTNAATTLLIHICQAMDKNRPEDVQEEDYEHIPAALDAYFGESNHKALKDKSILAEMIGRYGPRDGWDRAFRKIMADTDTNLRQFALHALEYCASSHTESVLRYITKAKDSEDSDLRHVAAHLLGDIACKSHDLILIKRHIHTWLQDDNGLFVSEIEAYLRERLHSRHNPQTDNQCNGFLTWLQEQLSYAKR